MQREQLVGVMLYQIGGLNRTGSPATESTVHRAVLSDVGPGNATPQRIYKAFVRSTFSLNGQPEPEWPIDWLDLSVGDLADRLLSSIDDAGASE